MFHDKITFNMKVLNLVYFSTTGVQNNNGQNVFDLVPGDGKIDPGGSVEITVTFAPDHASDHYSDGVKVELFGKVYI